MVCRFSTTLYLQYLKKPWNQSNVKIYSIVLLNLRLIVKLDYNIMIIIINLELVEFAAS